MEWNGKTADSTFTVVSLLLWDINPILRQPWEVNFSANPVLSLGIFLKKKKEKEGEKRLFQNRRKKC